MLTNVWHVRLVSRRKNYPFFLYIILTFLATGLPEIVQAQSPTNDDPCQAMELESPQIAVVLSTEAATADWLNSSCPQNSQSSVWFTFNLEEDNNTALFSFNGLGTENSFAIGRYPDGCEEDFKLLKKFCDLDDSDQIEIPGLHPDSNYYVVVSSPVSIPIQGSLVYMEDSTMVGCTQSIYVCETALDLPLQADQSYGFEACTFGLNSFNTGALGCFDFDEKPTSWIKFTTNGDVNFVNFNLISNELPELQMALFTGSCNNLIPIRCNMGFNGSVEMQLVDVEPWTTYALAIAASDCQVGYFSISFQGIGPEGSTCNTGGSIQTNPNQGSDPSGPFKPGETVNVCLEIPWMADGIGSGGNDCQWLHGITPEFGDGWDPVSFLPSGEPANITGTNIGPIFNWYESGVTYNNIPGGPINPGDFAPPGWFVTGIPSNNPNCPANSWQFDPNCSFGTSQSCGSNAYYYICFDLKTKSYPQCDIYPDANDLSITYKTFGDGETGGWTQGSCIADFPIIRNMALNCCDPIQLIPELLTTCSNQFFNIDLSDQFIGNNSNGASFTWNANYDENILFPLIANNDPNCSENCGNILEGAWINTSFSSQVVQYSVTATDADNCAETTEDFFVIVEPQLPADVFGPGIICSGECATLVGIGGIIFGGGQVGSSIELCPEISTQYEIEIFDPNTGCSQFFYHTVEVTPAIEISLETSSGQTNFCSGELPTLIEATVHQGSGGYAFEWNGPLGIAGIGVNYPAEVSGFYAVTVTDALGCSVFAEIFINESPAINAEIISDAANVLCFEEGENGVVLTMEIDNPTGVTYSYEWATDSGAILAGNGSPTIAAQGTGIYSCVVTDGNGCTAIDEYFLNILPPINIDFAIPSNICASPLSQDILAATPAGGIFSGAGVMDGEFIGETPGVYNVNYFVEDSNGCSAEASFDITVDNIVDGFVEHPAELCVSDELYPLVASPPGGVFSESPIIEGNNIRPTAPGVYDIVYTFGDPNSDCSGDYTFSVTVNETPQVDLELSNNEFCLGDSPQSVFMTSPNGGIFTSGNVNSNNEFIPNVPGENIIEYTYTDPNTGCSNSATTSILVVEPEPVNILPTSLLCIDEVTQLTAEPSGGIYSGENITSEGIFSSGNSGSFTITYTYENAAGCISQAETLIEVTDPPLVAVDHPVSVCQGNVPLDVLIPNISGGVYSGNVNAQGEFVPTTLGVNEITYTYTDPATGCSSTTLFTIEVLDQIVPEITNAPGILCYAPGESYQLIGNPAGGIFSGDVDANGNFQTNETGQFIIQYSTENSSACGATTSITIEVSEGPAIAVDAPQSICLGTGLVTLIATPSGGQFSDNVNAQGQFNPIEIGVNELSYEYTDANDCTSIYYFTIVVNEAQTPTILGPAEVCFDPGSVTLLEATPAGGTWSSNVNPNGIFLPQQVGLSTVTYTATDQNGCEGSASMDIQVNELPTLSVNYPASVCLADVGQVSISASPTGGVYTGPVDANGNLLATSPGIQEISYTFQDPVTGCSNSEAFTINIVPDIQVTVSHPEIVCLGNTPLDVLTPQPAGGVYTGAVNANGDFEPYTLGNNEITYTYTNPQNGCSGSYSFSIEVINETVFNQPIMETITSDVLCVGLVHQFCIYPVPNAIDYIWTSNNAIISYATANHLCVNVGWNMEGFDELCVVPVGECGPSPNALCLPINLVDDPACIMNTNVNELEKTNIHIYPNPATDRIQIDADQPLTSIVVYNALGQIVHVNRQVPEMSYTLNLGAELPGIYFVQVGKHKIERIIVAR